MTPDSSGAPPAAWALGSDPAATSRNRHTSRRRRREVADVACHHSLSSPSAEAEFEYVGVHPCLVYLYPFLYGVGNVLYWHYVIHDAHQVRGWGV